MGRGVKRTQLQALRRLGIETVRDMLYHFPSRYNDAASTFSGELEPGADISLIGTIEKIAMRRTGGKRRMMIAEATIVADGKRVRSVWFHQPYIAKQFVAGDVVQISGKTSGSGTPYFTNPIIRKTDGAVNNAMFSEDAGGGRQKKDDARNTVPERAELRAIYPETHGISSLFIGTHIRRLLSDEGIKAIEDPLPGDIRERLNLPNLYDALVYIHIPRNEDDHAAAKKRFIFEQTFFMQLQQQLSRNERSEARTYNLTVDTDATETFMRERFEFMPTKDQKTAVNDILADIQKNKPMARLLEGDVGSGKTAVAAAVIHGIISATPEEKTSGRPQVAYLAPTEVLAKQQFDSLVKLFNHLPVQIGIISGKECYKYPSKVNPDEATKVSKAQLKKWIASGEIAVIVGTHAVIQKDIVFKRLALAIIDEQHRFGVAQRQKLLNATDTHTPHLLSMTATPIPRTLALTIYGDLDISVIEEMPKGRKPVKTKLARTDSIQQVYNHIREEVQNGHQAYILCPRVLESDDSLLRSVEEEHKHISKNIFPDLEIGVLHGKMKPKEKQAVMERFSGGEINILVCTTVVEVGVNVPNATIIAILHAERFGLAQLHQLRGRVIRSSHQPHCYAVTDSKNEQTLERLKIFETIHNGFTLAQKDLDMRGSGELAGLRQSGVPDLVMEGLKNQKLLALAKQEAGTIVETDPTLADYPGIHAHIREIAPHNE